MRSQIFVLLTDIHYNKVNEYFINLIISKYPAQ